MGIRSPKPEPPSIEQIKLKIENLDSFTIGNTIAARKAEAESLDLQELAEHIQYVNDRKAEAEELENLEN